MSDVKTGSSIIASFMLSFAVASTGTQMLAARHVDVLDLLLRPTPAKIDTLEAVAPQLVGDAQVVFAEKAKVAETKVIGTTKAALANAAVGKPVIDFSAGHNPFE